MGFLQQIFNNSSVTQSTTTYNNRDIRYPSEFVDDGANKLIKNSDNSYSSVEKSLFYILGEYLCPNNSQIDRNSFNSKNQGQNFKMTSNSKLVSSTEISYKEFHKLFPDANNGDWVVTPKVMDTNDKYWEEYYNNTRDEYFKPKEGYSIRRVWWWNVYQPKDQNSYFVNELGSSDSKNNIFYNIKKFSNSPVDIYKATHKKMIELIQKHFNETSQEKNDTGKGRDPSCLLM